MLKKIIAVLGSLLGVFIATFLWEIHFNDFVLILIRILFIVVFAIAFGVTIACLVYKNSIKKLENYKSYEDTLTILNKSKQKFLICLGVIIPIFTILFFKLSFLFIDSFPQALEKYIFSHFF